MCYFLIMTIMTRSQAIAFITEKLASLEDERVLAVADIIKSIDAADGLPRELTPEELALIEQSKEDFRMGRTHTLEEARAMTDDFLAQLGVPRSRS